MVSSPVTLPSGDRIWTIFVGSPLHSQRGWHSSKLPRRRDYSTMELMKMLIRGIICAVLSASLSVALLPVQASVPPPAKSECCAKKLVANQHHGCGKDAPKSSQDQQCCATCFACVAVVQTATLIPKRSESEQSYFKFSEAAESRALRPPVPPPRDALT